MTLHTIAVLLLVRTLCDLRSSQGKVKSWPKATKGSVQLKNLVVLTTKAGPPPPVRP